eukprot:TRINITY_DN20771_c0_g1_i1.p2 TRINITY_DN20771_c0_g1~~TRINITY_DN20771_c0_g1_i1.p2  ORF type:complete len:349 (+),score=161.46 TRINITY_DN20771_c0_g1_i1:49-1047(+)
MPSFPEMLAQAGRVLEVSNPTAEEWFGELYPKRRPVVVSGADFGGCVAKWDLAYLEAAAGEKEVSASVCPAPQLTFHPRNYGFEAMRFTQLLKETHVAPREGRSLYYRSVGKNMRKDPANFWATWGDTPLGDDFHAPEYMKPQLAETGVFSSAFRVSSSDVTIWCHYDMTDGMLFQVRGVKHVLLFPPGEVAHLYIDGSSSLAGDLTGAAAAEGAPFAERFPLLEKALPNAVHAVLRPGDSLFIPATWFHTTWAEGPSVSLNIMWKPLPHTHYASNDLYGNKDLVAAGAALKAMEKVHAALAEVPGEYRSFYAAKIAADLHRRHVDAPPPSE